MVAAKSGNLDAAYAWMHDVPRPENAAVFTNNESTATASKDCMKFVNPEIKADFDRCLPPAVIDNIKWYPPLPAELEAMELKALDKVRAAK